MEICFRGEVEIQDNEFSMEFERFIVRENEISFEVQGVDDDGEFKGEGLAQLCENGRYIGEIKYFYPKFHESHRYERTKPWSDTAQFNIDSIDINKKESKCKVEGKWIDSNENWMFSGTLIKYNS